MFLFDMEAIILCNDHNSVMNYIMGSFAFVAMGAT